MAVIEIITDEGTTLLQSTGNEFLVSGVAANVAVVEVIRGLPGVQNVVVSDTQPDNPFEDMIWADTSGG